MKFAIAAILAVALTLGPVCASAASGEKPKSAQREAPTMALVQKTIILPPEVDMEAARTFIRIGFGLDESVNFQATQMLTPHLRTVQAQELIRMVESYNNFSGKKVADALGKFRGVVSGVVFGREGSPVIYIHLPYWTHQREEAATQGRGQRIPEAETRKVIKKLEEMFIRELAADEFEVDENQVRVWWD